ncbi:MAG: hypothetical protein RJA36_2789 [Pseudomonadota bacterium]|jgi:periplasmic divalent cation tolerance protein
MGTDLICVHTTTDTHERALALGRAIVERQLGACVQVSRIDSVYRWEGEVRTEPEFRLLVKTTRARYAQVEAVLRELHPYELPAIWAVEIALAEPGYAQWVRDGATGT